MKTHQQKEADNDLVIHYKTHRLILGLMGVFLPTALIIGSFIWNRGQIEDSISDYFYTCLRDVFVVTLCAVSIFLLTYKGYGGKDFLASNIAGVFGLITAYVPTNFTFGTQVACHQLVEKQLDPEGNMIVVDSSAYEITPVPNASWLGWLHLVCAAIFLLSLAYIAIREFTKSQGDVRLKNSEIDDPKKVRRNNLYRFCGWTIIIMLILLIPMFFSDYDAFYTRHNLVFWAEAICLWAFGTSWIVKGLR